MEIKYKRKIRQNFMMLTQSGGLDYEEKMLEGARHANLLSFERGFEAGERVFSYEITSMQPLSRIAEQRGISGTFLRRFVLQLDEVLFAAEAYMLSKSNLLLTPEAIYVDIEEETVRFCLVPGGSFCFEEQIRELLLFLLRFAESRETEAVILCHRLFQRVCRGEFEISDLTGLVLSGKVAEAEKKTAQLHPGRQEFADVNARESISRNNHAAAGEIPGEKKAFGDPQAEAYLGNRRKTDDMPEAWENAAGSQEENAIQEKPVWGKQFLIQFLLCFVIICIAPGIVILLRGVDAALRFLPAFCIADLCVILYFGISFLEKRKHGFQVTEGAVNDADAADTAADEMTEKGERREERFLETAMRTYREEQYLDIPEQEEEAEFMQNDLQKAGVSTRQLFEGEELAEAGIRRLSPLNRAFPQIILDHFPFVIGKSRNGTDGVIEDERVSRMHARIQQKDHTYYLTDLNSTNGTKLDGYLLNANETLPLAPGQELSIAGVGYVFL